MSSEIQALVEQYADAAKKHHELTPTGDWYAINLQAKIIDDCFKKIIGYGRAGRALLLDLTQKDDPAVALSAAVSSLKFNPEVSLTTLRRLASFPGIIGFGAAQSIKNWEEGRWFLEDDEPEGDADSEPMAAPPVGTLSGSLDELLRSLPEEVTWDAVPEFKRMDHRVSIANAFCHFTIGVNDGTIEWVPDHTPPTDREKLTWAWVIRPDLSAEIAERADPEFRQELLNYLKASR